MTKSEALAALYKCSDLTTHCKSWQTPNTKARWSRKCKDRNYIAHHFSSFDVTNFHKDFWYSLTSSQFHNLGCCCEPRVYFDGRQLNTLKETAKPD